MLASVSLQKIRYANIFVNRSSSIGTADVALHFDFPIKEVPESAQNRQILTSDCRRWVIGRNGLYFRSVVSCVCSMACAPANGFRQRRSPALYGAGGNRH